MTSNPTNTPETSNQPRANGPAGPEAGADFWRAIHRALRGRYQVALVLALVGAAVGAAIGVTLGKRLYASTGLVRIASVLPPVLRETDQNRPIAMFDGIIQAQREVMMSPETIQAAMKEESWEKVSRSGHAPSGAQFASSLKVETRQRSDHLRVTFTHTDPSIAAAAVQSIIAAYQTAFTAEQDRSEGQRVGQLRTRRESLEAELKKLDADNAVVMHGHEAAEVETMYMAASERVKKLRSALADVQCAMAGGPDVTQRAGGPARLPSEVAADEVLRSYASELARVENQLALVRSQGYQSAHRVVIRLEASAKELRNRVSEYTQVCETRRVASDSGPSPVSLSEREASLHKLALAAEEEMRELAGERTQMADYVDRAATIRQSLKETDSRMDALATEASQGSRLTIITGGEKPMTAVLDNRAKAGALGGMIGMAIPIGLLVVRSTFRRRYRVCEDVATDLQGLVPFVAVLPDLGRGAPLTTAAARCVHDLRVRLQPSGPDNPRTYLVTSASSGECKTSLSLALGLSFAAAGFRTLLIDGDLTTRRLSLGLDAGNYPGMVEATGGAEPSVRRIRNGLSILPAGNSRPQDACRLSPTGTARMLASLNERFDVVLIDGDPILTGITASVIAPQVGGVIVALSRGQDQPVVQSAVRHIGMLGAELAGAVFNRAAAGEFPAASKDQPGLGSEKDRQLPERLNRFGPLVGAVLSSLSLTRDNDLDLMAPGMSLAQTDEEARFKAPEAKKTVA